MEYKMRLHEHKELFQDAVIASSQQKGIPEIYIEKDYWVTFVLYRIFKNEMGKETIFKGGTALQKCFGLIQRFSEDIDLVVLRNESETGNQPVWSSHRKVASALSAYGENSFPFLSVRQAGIFFIFLVKGKGAKCFMEGDGSPKVLLEQMVWQ